MLLIVIGFFFHPPTSLTNWKTTLLKKRLYGPIMMNPWNGLPNNCKQTQIAGYPAW